MSKAKYQSVLDLGEKLNVQDGDVKEENGILHISGNTKTQHEKNLLWDEIKRIGGEQPSDIKADIKVTDNSVFAYHTVQSGDSLSKISKYYYGDPNKYNSIFQANTDQLKNPDLIHPGQVLKIPNS
tara:strand:+ start:52711 stop:53088 length:378 start_codon:yes stop_codon:yes gene_type:complete